MKTKLPFLKKQEVESDELEENSEADESSHQDDATGSADLSEIAESEEEGEEAVASNASLIHKLKAKIQSLSSKPTKSKADKTEVGEAAAEDDEAAKKKKRSKIIQAVIGLGLIAFLAEDYIIPKEQPLDNTPVPPPQARKRPEPKPADPAVTPPTETANTETPAEVPATETPATETPAEVTAGETTPADPTSTIETQPDSPVDVTSTEVPSESGIETAPESTPDATIEEPATTPDSSVISETPSDVTPPSSVDTIDGESTASDDNLTDQILQDLEKQAKDTQPKEQIKEYVSPPDYEYRGRGLVYNCSGKHWACVDAPSYKICEDNSASTQFLKKTVECHPVNIYETQKGCENIQNRMVSSGAKTAFCQ